MNPRINQLVRSLLQKESLEQCSLPELQQFAERHPYFGAAQLLLTKKMQSGNPEQYNEQLQKTLLYFNNPIWVEHLLNDTGHAEVIKNKKEEAVAAAVVMITPETPAGAPESVRVDEVPLAGLQPMQQEISRSADTTQPEMVTETFTDHSAAEPVREEEAMGQTETAHPAPEHFSPSSIPEEKLPGIPVLKNEPVNTANDELVLEPYYTVDYFASQGIRFREEEKPADKFGQQLKSFTEWLKLLRKVPVSEIVKAGEPASEKKVEEMAESSIIDREVLTETMAEVWEKQGNAAKAIEIYAKLSLLEPAKSIYFAAKIEDLKKQS